MSASNVLNNRDADYPPLPYLGYGPSPNSDLPALPMQMPQPVLYIPVQGPAPYNTLVVVHAALQGAPMWGVAEGSDHLNRFSYSLPTGFRFPNYDPRMADRIRYQHSTIASLNLLQASKHELFTVAVDQIDSGGFDDQGVWTLKLNLADQLGTGGDWLSFNASSIQFGYFSISSWILCYLPPAQDPAPPAAR